jgi:N-acetylglutamate synthase-like GNAT family acetyltransferase
MNATHTIEPFRPEYKDEVIALIVGIQHDEFGVAITAADQPDLGTISTFYQTGGGNFWVARRNKQVVGTIALKDIGNNEGALRKMFVAPEARGKEAGVAQQLLETLIDWVRQRGIERVYLGTTDAFRAAHRFYEKNGFIRVPVEKLPPSFPIMRQDTRYYLLKL